MIVLDTGPLYALTDRSDAHHDAAVDLLASIPGSELVLPSPVLTEVSWAIESKLGPRTESAFLAEVAKGVPAVEHLTLSDLARCAQLVEQYSDLPLGFVDASVVAVAERRGITTIATIDHRHFRVVRPRSGSAFQLVP